MDLKIDKKSKVILLSVITDSDDKEVKEISLDELERLADTAEVREDMEAECSMRSLMAHAAGQCGEPAMMSVTACFP